MSREIDVEGQSGFLLGFFFEQRMDQRFVLSVDTRPSADTYVSICKAVTLILVATAMTNHSPPSLILKQVCVVLN